MAAVVAPAKALMPPKAWDRQRAETSSLRTAPGTRQFSASLLFDRLPVALALADVLQMTQRRIARINQTQIIT